MKKLTTIVLLLVAFKTFAQSYNSSYGRPIVTLIESNPWLMVIGSDVPSFVIYEQGQVLYKKVVDKEVKIMQTKLSHDNTQALIKTLGITDSLFKCPNYIRATYGTDQPTNTLILYFDSVKQVSVYGKLRYAKGKDRKQTPAYFLNVYDKIINYDSTTAQEWLPDSVEVMLTDYGHSPEKPRTWPKEWPDLKAATTIKRSDDLYSVYLDKKYFNDLKLLMGSLKEKQAVEINGQKFSVSYRLPFPNLK